VNRFGKLIAILLLLAGVGLALVIRFQPGPVRPAARAAPGPAVAVTPSGLAIPVANVASAALYDSFGDARGDGTRGHGALDIMAPTGTPVLAATAGQVEKLFESERGGHTVYVRSPDRRFVYYYAHLDSYAPDLREGQMVRLGEQIGTVGSTGDADPSGPHLHFEIKRMGPADAWHGGAAINPYPLLAGNAARG
jgi:murein DD-endopeptidase MepM/ murein hydrolase activator NlpD